MGSKKGKRHVISIFFTFLIIGLLFLSGPASAIEVRLTTEDIDISTQQTQTFILEIEVKDGEFLPIRWTDLTFSADNSDDVICRINSDDTITGCDFLSVSSKTINNLDSRADFGFGYGYGYGGNIIGFQDFGYGYGYGYGTRGVTGGSGSGTITYNLVVNTALLPSSFIDKLVRVDAEVVGGDESNQASFRGSAEFSVTQSQEDLDLIEVTNAVDALTLASILNGNKNENNIIADLKLPTSLEGSGVGISWSSSNGNVISTTGTVTRSNSDETVTLTAIIQKGAHSATKNFTLIVKQTVVAAVPDAEGQVDLNPGDDEIVIDNTNFNDIKEIIIPDTVSEDEEVVLNLIDLVDNNQRLTLGANNLTLTRQTTGISYVVEIPAGTVIQGEADWNGLITLPTVKANTDVSIAGSDTQKIIEIGSSTVKLTFDKAVKIVIPGQAGSNAGWELNGIFTTISACTSSQLADPNTLPAEGDCFTSSGSDLIIWTKHFTKFVTYTSSATSGGGSSAIRGGGDDRIAPRNVIFADAIESELTGEETTTEEAGLSTQSEGLESTTEGEDNLLTGAVVGGGITKGLTGILIVIGIVVVGLASYIIIRRRKIKRKVK